MMSHEELNNWWITLSLGQKESLFNDCTNSDKIYCGVCNMYVHPAGLHTHEVSCPKCGEYFGCDD